MKKSKTWRQSLRTDERCKKRCLLFAFLQNIKSKGRADNYFRWDDNSDDEGVGENRNFWKSDILKISCTIQSFCRFQMA